MVVRSRAGSDYPCFGYRFMGSDPLDQEGMVSGVITGSTIQEAARKLIDVYPNHDYLLVHNPRRGDSVKYVEAMSLGTPATVGFYVNSTPFLKKDMFSSVFWRRPPLYGSKMPSVVDPLTGKRRPLDDILQNI